MRTALALSFILIAVAIPASAGHGACHPTSTTPLLTVGVPGVEELTFYLDVDGIDPPLSGYLPLPWLYQESNGVGGLQRADVRKDDTCGALPGDHLLV